MTDLAVDFQIRDKESFAFAKEVIKPYGVLDDIINWCKAELVGDWRWQMIEMSSDRRPGRYVFYFDLDRDVCAFVMKWG